MGWENVAKVHGVPLRIGNAGPASSSCSRHPDKGRQLPIERETPSRNTWLTDRDSTRELTRGWGSFQFRFSNRRGLFSSSVDNRNTEQPRKSRYSTGRGKTMPFLGVSDAREMMGYLRYECRKRMAEPTLSCREHGRNTAASFLNRYGHAGFSLVYSLGKFLDSVFGQKSQRCPFPRIQD